ncbi:MAG: type II toxin-antitoxin system prevent-host-death family antitoxin [Pyrinomonadaceae bacterium]
MDIVRVKILDPKVKRLLNDLESLRLIEIEDGKSTSPPKRRFGSMKGLVEEIADDFDAPIEELKEYI